MASLLDPFLLPRLAVRALDDVHVLASSVPEVLELGHRILDLGERIVEMGERLDARAERISSLGETLEARGRSVQALGERIEEQGHVLESVASEVARRGAEVAAALPLLERAIAIGAPLEGAVERLGRAVDRLPGGRGRGAANPDG